MTDLPRATVARVDVERLEDGRWRYSVILPDWVQILDKHIIAGMVHIAADQLVAVARIAWTTPR